MVAIWPLTFIIWAIVDQVLNQKGLSIIVTSIGSILDVIFIAWWSILDTFSNSRSMKRKSTTSRDFNELFNQIMNDPKYKAEFKRYLQGTWCLENLLFYEEVLYFKEVCQTGDGSLEAQRIFDFFFTKDSCVLNIDIEMEREMREKFQNAKDSSALSDPLLFDEVNSYIKKEYLIKNSLLKWTISPHFPKDL